MSASRLRSLGLMITSSWLFVGCSSAKKIDVGGACILNSDCNSSLVCAAGKCHDACHTSADCPTGQSCIIASDQSKVCQLPVETHCTYNSDCQTPLICAADLRCRNQCQTDVDCLTGQTCTTTKTCAEPSQVDSNNNLIGPDGGVTGSSGASGTGDAASCPTGAETCSCYGNDTCNTGLTCASHLCVSLGTGGAGGTTATGGASTNGGASAAGGTTSTGGRTSEQSFSLLVTETPPGPTIAQNLWEGVLRFTLTGDGAPLVAAGGIDKSQLADPSGLAFRAVSSEVFVGNRHGNTAADGVAGSISRFIYDPVAGTFTPNGTITGNGLNEVCQMAFNPVTGELFATDAGPAAISRFTFDGAGNAIPNGTLGTGTAEGVVITPDGKILYTTFPGGGGGNVILRYDLATGNVSTGATIATAPRLFMMAILNSELYVAALDVDLVYRLTIDSSDNLTLKDSFAADSPVGVAFSPDGREMFTSGHQSTCPPQ